MSNDVRGDAVRPCAVADMFYPGNAEKLQAFLEELFDMENGSEIAGDIRALICPHAGYRYSGAVAMRGYKHLVGRAIPLVVVIAPSHRDRFQGVSVFTGKGYESPLGMVEVAMDKAEALTAQHEAIFSSWLGHRDEHALEVQLPFLQKTLPDASIIPVVMGEQSQSTCRTLAQALATVLQDERYLIVASSDLSHFHPDARARQIDAETIRMIEQFDPDALAAAVQEGAVELCGSGPVLTAMMVSKTAGADAVQTLSYRNSGDATGDTSAVVGYLSAVFYKQR